MDSQEECGRGRGELGNMGKRKGMRRTFTHDHRKGLRMTHRASQAWAWRLVEQGARAWNVLGTRAPPRHVDTRCHWRATATVVVSANGRPTMGVPPWAPRHAVHTTHHRSHPQGSRAQHPLHLPSRSSRPPPHHGRSPSPSRSAAFRILLCNFEAATHVWKPMYCSFHALPSACQARDACSISRRKHTRIDYTHASTIRMHRREACIDYTHTHNTNRTHAAMQRN